ncbi:RRP15-like protein [Ischnura elegans]|uniref:RRP15-like protein n=1 Tax=Ischnura elegans TaxID=197161 RepID=UPI001ED8810C|nr:RRP15-like protein [Ischnura elegans]
MKHFRSSVLGERVADYEHPVNDDAAATSSESEANASSDESEDIESSDEVNESDGSESEKELSKGNTGWADAMSKILKTNKPKKKRTVVLSRAKKLSDSKISAEKAKAITFEIDGEIKQEKDTTEKPEEKPTPAVLYKVRKKEWESRGRVKPVYPDPERERSLSKIAIKGVVQLFNAVQKHQSEVENKLKEVGGSEIKRERVLKSVDKRAFLDVLMGNTKSEIVDSPVKSENKGKVKKEESQQPIWSVLRDDFLTDPSLKDWDKETENEENDNMSEGSSSSDEEDVDMT